MQRISLFIFIVVSLSSCIKEKSYTCECTYVPMSAWHPTGTPNKVETTTIKGRIREQAATDCDFLDNKYFSQHYDGTCVLK